MASGDIKNPSVPVESKSAKKKKAKAAAAATIDRTESPAPASETAEKRSNAPNDSSQDEVGDNAHIRELRKRLRSIQKKLAAVAKTESLIADHANKKLDELVAQKVINADQKAQFLSKPELDKQLQSVNTQIKQLQEVELEHKIQIAALEKSLTEKFEKEKADLVAELKEKAEADSTKVLSDSFLILSQFLRLAAARRAEETDSALDENMALEGVLLQVYSGDQSAVATILKLVQGADEPTLSTGNEILQTTFAQVKKASIAHLAPIYASETLSADSEAIVESKEFSQTDPTVANAGLTEIDEGSTVPLTNGHTEEEPLTNGNVPANADVTDDAANAAGESQWDTPTNDMSMSQEWVEVKAPRDPSETETGLNATPAAPAAAATTQSWADDQPDPIPEPPAAADPNDGFQSVQRNRGNRDSTYRPRGGDRGGFRGRGRGGGGFRGDGRGRGRGRGDSTFRSMPRRPANGPGAPSGGEQS